MAVELGGVRLVAHLGNRCSTACLAQAPMTSAASDAPAAIHAASTRTQAYGAWSRSHHLHLRRRGRCHQRPQLVSRVVLGHMVHVDHGRGNVGVGPM